MHPDTDRPLCRLVAEAEYRSRSDKGVKGRLSRTCQHGHRESAASSLSARLRRKSEAIRPRIQGCKKNKNKNAKEALAARSEWPRKVLRHIVSA